MIDYKILSICIGLTIVSKLLSFWLLSLSVNPGIVIIIEILFILAIIYKCISLDDT